MGLSYNQEKIFVRPNMDYSIKLKGNEKVKFNNNVDFCVGTGRMGLALTKEYLDELELVQKDIGFKFIRGHGLFCDDMSIYQVFYETDKNHFKSLRNHPSRHELEQL